jgi:hypothetical protein
VQVNGVQVNRAKAFRVLGPAAAAVLVAGVALLATTLASAQAGAATPWLNQHVRIPAVTAGRAGAAACEAKDISVRLARRGIVQDGYYAYVYGVRNVSGKTCFAASYPRITVGGKAVRHGPDVLSVAAGDLRPGQTAMFALTQTTAAGCSAGRSQNGVMKQVAEPARMPAGAHGTRLIGRVLVSNCTKNSVTALGLAPAEPKADALSRLSVRLRVPATATAGQTLKFEVVLTNPTRAPIRLSPCPGYEIGLSAAGQDAYRLNCADPVIAAGQSRAFEMEYRLPAGTRPGLAKVGWLLLNPRRTGSGTVIKIVN